MMKRPLIISGIGIICLVLLGFFIFGLKHNASKNQSTVSRILPKEVLVTLSDTGFTPKTVTIAAGSAVRFKNNTTAPKASVNSDDYPTNRKYPELNLGLFQKGATLVHIFTKSGIYTYHDQFDPQFNGTIIVR